MPRLLKLLLHYLRLADHPEPWEGPQGPYYISDKEATMAHFRRLEIYTGKQLELLEKLFGHTVTAHIQGRWFLISKDYVEEIRGGRMLRRGRNYWVCESYSAIHERILRARMKSDGDGYWTFTDAFPSLPGYGERLRPISEDEFLALAAEVKFDDKGFPITTPPPEEDIRIARTLPR